MTYAVYIAHWTSFNMKKSSTPLEGYSDADTCFKRTEKEKCNGKLDWHPGSIHVNGKEPYDLNNLGYCLNWFWIHNLLLMSFLPQFL